MKRFFYFVYIIVGNQWINLQDTRNASIHKEIRKKAVLLPRITHLVDVKWDWPPNAIASYWSPLSLTAGKRVTNNGRGCFPFECFPVECCRASRQKAVVTRFTSQDNEATCAPQTRVGRKKTDCEEEEGQRCNILLCTGYTLKCSQP